MVLAAEVDNLLPFFVNGVFRGGGYALAGLGLVLIFRIARVVNFAHGAIATFCTFAFVALRGAVPTPLALLGALALGALFGLVVEFTTMRPLQERPEAAKLVATIGWLLLVQFATGLVFGGQPETVAPIAPTTAVGIFGVRIAYYQILLLVTAVVVAVLLWYWLNRTSFGTALRAVSSDRGSAQLLSVNANRITTVAWAVGGALAALAGILIAPGILLDSQAVTVLLFRAFAVALIAGFHSIGLVLVAALLLGGVEDAATVFYRAGSQDLVMFALVVGVLLLRSSEPVADAFRSFERSLTGWLARLRGDRAVPGAVGGAEATP
jgi:branched-subunit amino acid ABC-type transport system permease component